MMLTILKPIHRYWSGISIALLVVITALSLWPLEQLPEAPGSDKLHHLLAYGVLMFPAALRQPRLWQLLVAGFIAWSGAIELIQPLVNRYAEWQDMLANTLGIVCGIVLGHSLRRYLPDEAHK